MEYLNNFIDGTIAGSTAAFVSHPFLVIKNTAQNGYEINYKKHINVKWLYSGLLRAMCSYSVEKMIVFGVYNSLRQHNYDPAIAGGIAGLLASFSIAPGEQLTIDKQLGVKNVKLNNIFGSLSHLYQGLTATIFRESLGFMIHFSVYNYLTEKFNKEKSEIKTIMCGTSAVIFGWGSITPIDRIKTQIQSGTFNIKTYDFTKSFTGFRFALLRAIPFHVTCFLVMEHLNGKKYEDI